MTDPVNGLTQGGNATVYVSDLPRAVGFYTERLGMASSWANDYVANLDAGRGFTVALVRASDGMPVPGTAGSITMTLTVSRPLDEAIAELRAAGIDVSGPFDSDRIRLAVVADPDGNRLSIAEYPKPQLRAKDGTSIAIEQPPLFSSLGLQWTRVEDDCVEVELASRPDLLGPAGLFQGGVMATLADAAAGLCAATCLGHQVVATRDLFLRYLAPFTTGTLRATARPLSVGSGGAVIRVELVDRDAGDVVGEASLAFSRI
jgi:uncharacterized protein (TIGR00369 family)